MALFFVSCATGEEAREGTDRSGLQPASPVESGLRFAPTHPEVKTVQVYCTGDETALPVIRMRSGETISVQFDVMNGDSRPLTAYFYHADREWRRDLVPSEYLEAVIVKRSE